MSKHLRIDKVMLNGFRRDYVFQFGSGLNIIAGPIGTGKSSLFELIKYGFGGDGVIKAEVQNSVQSVSLIVHFGETTLMLTRALGTGLVTVARHPDGEMVGEFPIARRKDVEDISSFLLQQVDLEPVQMPSSRARPSRRKTTFSFFDVFKYLYLPQEDIDTSVVGHTEQYYEPKRLGTFEILFGLTNEEIYRLSVGLGEIKDELLRLRGEEGTIRNFLRAVREETEETLKLRIEHLSAELELAEIELAQLKRQTRTAGEVSEEALADLASLEDEATQLSTSSLAAQAELARLRAIQHQLELDLQRLDRAMSAETTLSSLQFQVCPNCQQQLRPRDIPENHCSLCLQPVDPEVVLDALHEERETLLRQLKETSELIEGAEGTLEASQSAHDVAVERLRRRREEVDRATRDVVSPMLSAMESLVRKSEGISREIAVSRRALLYWERLGSLEEDIAATESEEQSLNERIAAAQQEMAVARAHIQVVSELFDGICRDIRVPWYEGGRIDTDDYLPVLVGETSFERLSAGVKTLVNVAYHLAALVFTLTSPTAKLPTLLMIDAPRKNLGADDDDQSIGVHLYERLAALHREHGEECQLLLADNDVPDVARSFVRYQLSYVEPLIVDAEHPGPDNVERIG
jgi:hypothetical protein